MIYVVDHQVQDHVHVQAARAEQVHAVDFEEKRQGGAAFQLRNRGIETFEMAHLEDAAVAAGGFDEAIGGGQVAGDGLFHQHVETAGEQGAGDRLVSGGGDGHHGGVHQAGSVAKIGQCAGAVGFRHFGRPIRVGIHDCGKLRARGFVDHTAMVLAELARANDCQPDLGHGLAL